MLHLFLECTIRAALIVGATALVLYAMRVKVASVKHRIWTAVLLLMLALPMWIAWGPKAPIRILPANVENFTADLLVQTPPPTVVQSQKSAAGQATPAPAQDLLSPLEWSFLGLYLFGAFILLARLAIGTWKARQLVRKSSSFESFFAEQTLASANATPIPQNKERGRHPEARPRSGEPKDPCWFAASGAENAFALTELNRPHSIRISSACAAPVTVGFFRPTILLPENWCEWSASQLAAVLAHESEHARRCDPLVQWLALFNRAIFWFHPAAWWLERELSALAEECCDAAVLAQGHNPDAYAETLMHMARAIMQSGARVNATGTAMPGPRLPRRIRSIIEERSNARISRRRLVLLAVACTTICAAFVALRPASGVVRAPQSVTQKVPAAPLPSFEVASIRPTPSNGRGGQQITESSFNVSDVTMKWILMVAYKVAPFQIVGGPGWISSKPYTIDAKEDDVTAARLQKLSADQRMDQIRLMLQSLLVDRFKLVVKHETTDAPIYSLIVIKPGKIREDEGACGPTVSGTNSPGEFCGGLIVYPGHTSGQKVPISDLVNQLTAVTQRIVIDNTGLGGKYDITLNWTPDPGQTGPPLPPGVSLPKPDPNGPSVSAALAEQLGLKLVSTTGPVEKIVIEDIEEPTPN